MDILFVISNTTGIQGDDKPVELSINGYHSGEVYRRSRPVARRVIIQVVSIGPYTGVRERWMVRGGW